MGVTDEMEQLAALPPHADARTAILTAHLTAAPNTHRLGSSFRSGTRPEVSLVKHVTALLKRSPGLCAPNVTVHVVHDTNATSATLTALAGTHETRDDLLKVRWRRVPPDRALLGNDQRWVHFADVLRDIEWDCAYAVDLSDVFVLRVPPCAALGSRLVVASDGATKPWLRSVAHRTGWSDAVGADFVRLLADSRPVVSCGIVGGPRAAFEPALRSVVARMRAHARRARHNARANASVNAGTHERSSSATALPLLYRPGSDMVLWNDEALRARTILGYPHGPTNLPPWSTPHTSSGGRQTVCPTHACRHAFVSSTRHLFWFGHKIVDSWVKDYHRFYKECDSLA